MAPKRYLDLDFEASNDNAPASREKLVSRTRRPSYSHSNRATAHNGIHRRRNKKFNW